VTGSSGTSLISGFYLKTGPVADQTFANGLWGENIINFTPILYIGGNNYTDLISTNKTSLTLTADSNGLYSLLEMGFGQATFDS
jgi:hypothetical protein